MKKEIKQHLIHVGIIIILVAGIIFYQHTQTTETRSLLNNEISETNQEINNLKEKNTQLENNLNEAISKLNIDIQEKDTEIKTLTGELEQVKTENKEQLGELESKLSKLKAQNKDFSGVIEEVVPSVVSIGTNLGSGSGFIISSNGYVVTNYHVIEGATSGSAMTSDGENHKIRILGYNEIADVAVLELEGNNFEEITFGDSDEIEIGESVIAVGSPGGLDFTVTQGIVSAQRTDQNKNQYIQIDVPINPGNSGGPLINSRGKVIGVNTKKISEFEGVGFALASDFVQNIVEEILAKDRENKVDE